MYLPRDRHTMVATIYPPGNAGFASLPPMAGARAALERATPDGVTAVSVLASITLLPAFLTLLRPSINRVRVMPRRFVRPLDPGRGFWAGWARLVTRRPLPVFLIGAAVVTLFVLPAFHMNPSAPS